jgi:outer membrane immunogenic protein
MPFLLDEPPNINDTGRMKSLTRLLIAFFACNALVLVALAGPESLPRNDYKESKTMVAPVPPPPCDWTGFYIGINGGGVFGNDTEVTDVDEYNVDIGDPGHTFSYDADGWVGGGQLGYNFQIGKWFVLGVEGDGGYLGVDGRKRQPGSPGDDTFAETNPGFYTTLRARVGVTFNCLMIYATGGGFGSDYERRVEDDCNEGPCGDALGSGSDDDFRFGWTVGGGAEWAFTRHWSVKVEYLHYDLGDDDHVDFKIRDGTHFRWRFDEDGGDIVRGGVNFRF